MIPVRISSLDKRLGFLELHRRELALSKQESSFVFLLSVLGMGRDNIKDGQDVIDALHTIFRQAHLLYIIRQRPNDKEYVLIQNITFILSLHVIEAVCELSKEALALQRAYVDQLMNDQDELMEEARFHVGLSLEAMFEIYKINL